MSRCSAPASPANFTRAGKHEITHKRWHRERRRALRALPSREEHRVNARTGRLETVRVVLCPPACGELGTCPVARPYYPGEATAFRAQDWHASAWDLRVPLRPDVLAVDPWSEDAPEPYAMTALPWNQGRARKAGRYGVDGEGGENHRSHGWAS